MPKGVFVKSLVVYYSLEENTHYLAESIAECIGADLLRLVPVKDIKNTKTKYLVGGRQAVMKKKPKLLPCDKNPEDYDMIIIGTPVWASTITPAVRSFLSSITFKDKKIGLFCCHRGGPGKTLVYMEDLLEGNDIIGKTDFREPIKDHDEQRKKACDWAQSLLVNK
ncbi:MAG: flavodoxin [Candidatus Cloacimonetes bacterium]|nr:flavodoxin [Candidatus Cloacimonadota bacterium]